ncbi:MAG TPA: hypothetical protein VIL39_06555 [Verrucomicrobiae bacterium]
MLFALIHGGPILPELVEGGNRQVLPVFWRFCPIAKTVGGRQRPSGQAMREKQRDSGANRAGGGQCRAEARLQTGLENNGSQSAIRRRLQARGFGVEAAWGGDGAGVIVAPPEGLEKGLETRPQQWDYSIMKLVADDNGRLACKSLFTPKRAFSAERQADGSIRLVELVEKEVPVVRARKVNGRWMGAEMQLDRAKVIRAIRADREAR